MWPKQQRRAWVKSRRVSDIVALSNFGLCDSNCPISSNLVIEKSRPPRILSTSRSNNCEVYCCLNNSIGYLNLD
jgi:hypothetical protein